MVNDGGLATPARGRYLDAPRRDPTARADGPAGRPADRPNGGGRREIRIASACFPPGETHTWQQKARGDSSFGGEQDEIVPIPWPSGGGACDLFDPPWPQLIRPASKASTQPLTPPHPTPPLLRLPLMASIPRATAESTAQRAPSGFMDSDRAHADALAMDCAPSLRVTPR